MTNSTENLCLEEEVISSDANIIIALTLLVVSLFCTSFSAAIFFLLWRKHYITNKRLLGPLLTTSGGALLQLIGWSVFDIVGREGVPCWWLQTLCISSVTLLLAPIAIRFLGFWMRVLINKRLAKLHVLSATRKNDHYATLNNEVEIKNSSGSLGSDSSFTEQYMRRLIFLASPRFANICCVLLVAISLGLSYWATQNAEVRECSFPCKTEIFSFESILVQIGVVASACGYLLWKIREESDPLRIRFEALLILTIGSVSGYVPMMIYLLDDDKFFRPRSFSPTLIWVFGLFMLLQIEFLLPVLLVLNQKNNKKNREYEPDLKQILADNVGRDLFKAFSISEFSMENFAFYFEAKEYKSKMLLESKDVDALDQMRCSLIGKYIGTGSPFEINVPFGMRDAILQNTNTKEASLFDPCVDEVFMLMASDSFIRFKRTPAYELLIGTITLPEMDLSEV